VVVYERGGDTIEGTVSKKQKGNTQAGELLGEQLEGGNLAMRLVDKKKLVPIMLGKGWRLGK